MRARGGFRPGAVGVAMLASLPGIGSGCSVIPRALDRSVQGVAAWFSAGEPTTTIDPVKLQDDLLRYSDDLTSTVLRASTKLKQDGAVISRQDLLTIWIAVDSEVIQVATGSNSLANLVNMIVLTTALRMRVEEYWLPQVYGESARPLLDGLSRCEAEIWLLGEHVITPAEKQELLQAIERWLQEAKERPTSPSFFASFANTSVVSAIIESNRAEADSPDTGVFSLLDMDPLAGLDPATRELAQTRLLAERAMFIGVRLPQVIQWQAELLAIQTVEMLHVEQLVANTTQLAAAMDRVGRLADEIPRLVGSDGRDSPGLVHLSREIRLALDEGARMAASTDAALKTFDTIMARLDAQQDERASSANGEPFRIRDYADTAAEISRMSEQLTTLLSALRPHLTPETLTRVSTAAETVAANTQARGNAVVDYAFRRGLQLVAAVLVAALAYRAISVRWIPPVRGDSTKAA